MEELIGNEENKREAPSSLGMAKVVGMRKLTRVGCLRKRPDQILCSDPENLLRFSTELKKHGESIVEPQNLSEIIEAVNNDVTNVDFKGVLNSILEVLVLSSKIALVLKYLGAWEYIQICDDVVEELTRSDYGILRAEILTPRGAQEALHGQGVDLQRGKAPSIKKPLKTQGSAAFTKRSKQ
ncbi:hypothetical protein ACHQM5_007454 [Ranunculus cassubicifolius]